jgi:hypothetical protein
MTFVSLSLITSWMAMLVLGVSYGGFVHLLPVAAAAIVFFSGNRARRIARLPDVTPPLSY